MFIQAVGIEVQRRPGGTVPEQRADCLDIHAQFEQARGERVPQRVKVCAGKPQPFRQMGKAPLDSSRVSGSRRFAKYILRSAAALQSNPEQREDKLRYRNDPA